MRHACKCALRDYMANHLLATRKDKQLTQAKFSEDLMIDTRSYIYLEHGKNLCCTLTFIIYLCFYCKDVNRLIDDLRQIILKTQSKNDINY